MLSGGSGTRLWPLSNDARSKQFLRLLDREGFSQKESMVQRVVRQLSESGINADVTFATGASQKDSIISQLGNNVNIVTEPSRRDTFPAICLACEYLSKKKKCSDDEIVVVMPCDPYTQLAYFDVIKRMAIGIEQDMAELMVMGINPTYPSSKYGYIVPTDGNSSENIIPVKQFTEKPSEPLAKELLQMGAKWNGGVFAFKLGYLKAISEKYVNGNTYQEIYNSFDSYPKISFDYEVAEKANNVGMVEFEGDWKDLGTWNTLTDELSTLTYGNVVTDGTGNNTHIFNELDIPLLCVGTDNLVVAASPDGILVTEKFKSENIKNFANSLKVRPMYEERRWGTYRVIDHENYPDGYSSLTKRIILNPGASISYQKHGHRSEIWTFVDGEGVIVLDGKKRLVTRGDVVNIEKDMLHALKAITQLTFIEVQLGDKLIEEDIERFPFDWSLE